MIYLDEGKFAYGTRTEKVEGQNVEYLTLLPNKNHNFGPTFIATTLNFASTLWLLYTVIIQGIEVGVSYLKNHWAIIDVVFCMLNIYISLGIFGDSSGFADDKVGWKDQRIIEAIVAVLIWTKSLYYMQLSDHMAPLVLIIFKVFFDIKWFILTLSIAIFAFSNSFYLLGKNQIMYDELSKEEYPPYATVIGSLEYMYLMALGEIQADGDFFAKGKATQELLLWLLFLFATLTIILHLMNMLIAIMGETFSNNNLVEEENRLREHLKFIVENQWIDALGEQKNKVIYLVTAFLNEEDEEDVEILKDLQEDVQEMRFQTNSELENIYSEIKKIKTKLGGVEAHVNNLI